MGLAQNGSSANIKNIINFNYVTDTENYIADTIEEMLEQTKDFHARACYAREISIYREILNFLATDSTYFQSSRAKIYLHIAIAQLYQGNYKESRLTQRQVDKLDSNSWCDHEYGKALDHVIHMDTVEPLTVDTNQIKKLALKFLEKAFNAEPTNKDYMISYVGMLANLNKIPQGFKILSSITEDAKDAEYYNMQAHLYLSRGEPKNALQSYRNSLMVDPNQPVVCEHMGLAYSRLGDLQACYDSYLQAYNLDPTYERLITLEIVKFSLQEMGSDRSLADIFTAAKNTQEEGNHYKAIARYQYVITNDATTNPQRISQSYFHSSQCRYSLVGASEQAINDLLQSIKSETDSSQLAEKLSLLAKYYLEVKQYEKAEARLKEAVRLEPNNMLYRHQYRIAKSAASAGENYKSLFSNLLSLATTVFGLGFVSQYFSNYQQRRNIQLLNQAIASLISVKWQYQPVNDEYFLNINSDWIDVDMDNYKKRVSTATFLKVIKNVIIDLRAAQVQIDFHKLVLKKDSLAINKFSELAVKVVIQLTHYNKTSMSINLSLPVDNTLTKKYPAETIFSRWKKILDLEYQQKRRQSYVGDNDNNENQLREFFFKDKYYKNIANDSTSERQYKACLAYQAAKLVCFKMYCRKPEAGFDLSRSEDLLLFKYVNHFRLLRFSNTYKHGFSGSHNVKKSLNQFADQLLNNIFHSNKLFSVESLDDIHSIIENSFFKLLFPHEYQDIVTNPNDYLINSRVKNYNNMDMGSILEKNIIFSELLSALNTNKKSPKNTDILSNINIIKLELANLKKFSENFTIEDQLYNENLKIHTYKLDACAMSFIVIAEAWTQEIMLNVADNAIEKSLTTNKMRQAETTLKKQYNFSEEFCEFLSFSVFLANILKFNFKNELDLKSIALHAVVSAQFVTEINILTALPEPEENLNSTL